MDPEEIIAALAALDDGAKALAAGFAAIQTAHDVNALSSADRAQAQQLADRMTDTLRIVHTWIHEHPLASTQ